MPVDSLSSVQTLSLPAPPASVRAWRVGAILQATVLEISEAGSATLQIGNVRVQASSAQPLQAGTTLELKVLSLEPKPTLQRLEPADTVTETRSSALRAALPRQGGLAPLLANLLEAAQPGTARTLLPQALAERIAQLVQSLPAPSQVSHEGGLQSAIENSGLFLESRLATAAGNPSQPPPVNDFKAGLLRLAALLGAPAEATAGPSTAPPPPTRAAAPAAQPSAAPTINHLPSTAHALAELSHQVDAALARIQVGQLSVAAHDAGASPYWLVELPVRAGDTANVLQLRIEREPRRTEQDAPEAWALTVALDLTGLGPLYARVSYAQGRIGTRLWAESTDTHRLVERYAPVLEQNLKDAGLEVSAIICVQGSPPAGTPPPGEPGLVDLQV